jgi:hypothetical protein
VETRDERCTLISAESGTATAFFGNSVAADDADGAEERGTLLVPP